MYNGDSSVHIYAPGILELSSRISYIKSRIRHELKEMSSCMIDVKGFCWEIYAHRSPPYRAWDSVASRGLCVGGKRKNLKPVTVLEQRTSQTRAGFLC